MEAITKPTLNILHIGQAARRRRRELGITQAEFAEMAAVSVGWLSAFENGRPGCAFGTVIEVLGLLDLWLVVCASAPSDASGTGRVS